MYVLILLLTLHLHSDDSLWAASRGSIVPQNTKSTVPPAGEQHCSTAVLSAADCAAVARTAACAEEECCSRIETGLG